MLNINELKQRTPILIFVLIYTLLFLLFVRTFQYTFPLFIGLGIAYITRRPIQFVTRKFKMKNSVASALITSICILLLFAALCFLTMLAIREFINFLFWFTADDFVNPISLVTTITDKLKSILGKTGRIFVETHMNKIADLIANSASIFYTALNLVMGTFTSVPIILTWLITTIVSAFVFSKHMDTIIDFFASFFSADAIKHIKYAAKSTESSSIKSFLSYTFLYFIAFCESLIVTSILQLEYPVTISIIVCIADILPVLGPGIVYLPLAGFHFLMGHYAVATGLIIGFLIITITREIIEPKLVSASTKIHPLIMIAAVYFSLIANNFWIMFYFMWLFMFYGLFKESGALPAFYKKKDVCLPNEKE